MSYCAEYKGALVIIDDWQSNFNEPYAYRSYWPVNVLAKDYLHLIGKLAHHQGNGLYSVKETLVRLEKAGQTLPVFVEKKPLKKPPWAKSYSSGEWKRY